MRKISPGLDEREQGSAGASGRTCSVVGVDADALCRENEKNSMEEKKRRCGREEAGRRSENKKVRGRQWRWRKGQGKEELIAGEAEAEAEAGAGGGGGAEEGEGARERQRALCQHGALHGWHPELLECEAGRRLDYGTTAREVPPRRQTE